MKKIILFIPILVVCGCFSNRDRVDIPNTKNYSTNPSVADGGAGRGGVGPGKSAEELERQKKSEEMRKNLEKCDYFNGIVGSFSDDQVRFFSKILEEGKFSSVFIDLQKDGQNLKNFKDMSVESLQDSFDFLKRNPTLSNSWVQNASEYAKLDKNKFQKILNFNKPLPEEVPIISGLDSLSEEKLDFVCKHMTLYNMNLKMLSWIEKTPINIIKKFNDKGKLNRWNFDEESEKISQLSTMQEENLDAIFSGCTGDMGFDKSFLQKMPGDAISEIDKLSPDKIESLVSKSFCEFNKPNNNKGSFFNKELTLKKISSLGKMSLSNLRNFFLLDKYLLLNEDLVDSFANLSHDKLSALLTDLDKGKKKSQLDKITKEQVNFLASLSEEAIDNLTKEGALALDAKYIDIFKDVDSEKKCIIFEKAKTKGVLYAKRLTNAGYLDSLATFKSLPVENLKIVLDAVGNKVLLPNKGCIEALSKITDLDNIKVIAPYTLGDAPRINDKAIKILGNCNKTKVESITKSFYPNTNSIIFEKQFAFLSEKVSDQSKLPSLSKILQLSNMVNESFNMMIGIKSYCSDDDFMELLNKYSPAVLEKYISGQSEADIANAFGVKGGVLSYYDKDYAMNSPFSKSKVVNKLEILATLEKNGALN